MKKVLRALFITLLVCSIVFSTVCISGYAASTTLIFEPTALVNKSISVTLKLSADESMYATEAYVSFDSSKLKFNSGSSAVLDGNRIKIVGTPGGAKTHSYTLNFTTLAAGETWIKATGIKYVGDDEKSLPDASDKLTIFVEKAKFLGSSMVCVGQNMELIVNVADCPDVSSVAVELAYSDCFEFINAEWLQAGSLSNFDTNTNMGALSGLESANINGNLLKITLKATKEAEDAQINVQIIGKNSDVVVMDATATKDIAFGTPGDLNEDGKVTDADAVHLLMHTFFPDTYPVAQDCDYNGDGKVTDADAVHLLMYTFFPETYPIA